MAYSAISSSCSFREIVETECGPSRGVEGNVLVSECMDDITSHLASCHLSKCSKVSENELILARAGIRGLSEEQVAKMTICPRHRHLLGRFWRAPRSCQYPGHTGKITSVTGRHVVNFQMASEISILFDKTIPVGSPICTSCRKKHSEKKDALGFQRVEKSTIEQSATMSSPLPERTTKDAAKAAISAHAAQLETTPFWQPPIPCSPIASPCWTPEPFDLTPKPSNNQEVLSVYNKAMDEIATEISCERAPLNSQLDSWEKSNLTERQHFIQKATEDCTLVCDVIAPKDGKHLFQALTTACKENLNDEEKVDDVTRSLMSAYRNAKTSNTKTQILSLYAYKYSVSTLKELHYPYEKLSTHQINQARCHARTLGPGTVPEEKRYHRVRIDMSKLDHFIEFINRPYFYQDVSYGTKVLKLDSGETMEMPNVVRTVTRSTMINQYMQLCQEEKCEPLSRTTLFKILDVREASQRKSLQGLDNTAADGSAAFQTVEMIIDSLEKAGLEKKWCTEAKRKLKDAKRYLKTDYRVHCKPDEAACPDHCRKFAFSDKQDPDFQEFCSHQHSETCRYCENLKNVLDEVEVQIRGSSWHPYSEDQQEDLLYDFRQARTNIFHWKAHIVRSVNQEAAKQDQLKMIAYNPESALLVMDWAMKFQQLRYREKQSDWYAKRGLSWHISTVICSDPENSGSLELQSYAHLFDACQQDWFAVCSVAEHTLQEIKRQKPHVSKIYLRSDEAGCYHNFLIAAAKDFGQRMGIDVCRYDYSEPQYGKDVCDRILCPMKSCIRRFCDEGHDILTAADMKRALSERPVIGTTACVCAVDETRKTLEVKKMEGFNRLHNFQFEEKGIRVWRSYGKGPGKEFPFDQLVSQSQESTALLVISGFFDCKDTRVYKCQEPLSESSDDDRDNQLHLFECSEPGCVKSFPTFSELESHLNVGDHIVKQARKDSETLYDKLRRNWVERFTTAVNITEDMPSTSSVQSASDQHDPRPPDPAVCMGWALAKPRAGPSKFTDKVKKYLTAKFHLGEQTGRKADPLQVSNDMRKAKDAQTNRLFTREEWLTKSQVQGFFSRLAATKRRQQGSAEIELDQRDLLQDEEFERQNLVAEIAEELRPQHPLSYDAFNLCVCAKEDQLSQFHVAMLKEILRHFEIPFKSRERKRDLIDKLSSFIRECTCFSQGPKAGVAGAREP